MKTKLKDVVDLDGSDKAVWESEFESIPGVSRISGYDFLKQSLQGCEEADSFLTSPTYYSFTGRRGLWAYQEDDALLFVCWHPNVRDQILVFPQLRGKEINLILDLMEVIPVPSGGIQMARFKAADLCEQTSMQYQDRYVALEKRSEVVLDWKYPVHILSTAQLSALEGPEYQQLRHKIRQAKKHSIQVVPFDPVHYKHSLENLLRQWAKKNAANPRECALLHAPYESLFSLSADQNSGLSGLMIFCDKRLEAIGLWDVSNAQAKTANLFVNFCNTDIKGISEFLTAKCCEALHAQDIPYLNLGGSEGEGLDTFKRRFKPAMSINLCSADVAISDDAQPTIRRTTDFKAGRATGWPYAL